MNSDTLIDHAFNLLEGDAADRAALEIGSDPVLADRLDRLGRSLHFLLDDGAAYDPPAGLAGRTLAFVGQGSRARASVIEFPAPARRRFRVEDFAVAATIFLASLLALTPAILKGRERWGRAACANQLQKVGMRLNQFAAMNDQYPFVEPDAPYPHVGAMFCDMNESGLRVEPKDLQCPCSGSDCGKLAGMPNQAALAEMAKHSPAAARKALDTDYAFHVGYRDGSGQPIPLPAHPLHMLPLVADRPGFNDAGAILEGNSPNHGGRGQNVYFADGHVSWLPTRYVSPRDGDLFLNNDNRPAYGLDLEDSVLIPPPLRVLDR